MDIYSKEYYNVYGTQLEALFVELVAARQRIAEYLGYRSYPEFAYEFYYGRDYTPAQAARLMDGIRQELVPLDLTDYRQAVNDALLAVGTNATEFLQLFQKNHLIPILSGMRRFY